jgi:peptide-methionine (R)-S-oxide reductase
MSSEDKWRKKLTKMQYEVLRKKGTEPPFFESLVQLPNGGDYACAACGNVLFSSSTSFESITPGLIGWPSFSAAARLDAVRLEDDFSFGMQRIEVICNQCDGHLGHYFDDPAAPEGAHYCINACVLVPSDIDLQGETTAAVDDTDD